jgi:hypothetical protein
MLLAFILPPPFLIQIVSGIFRYSRPKGSLGKPTPFAVGKIGKAWAGNRKYP